MVRPFNFMRFYGGGGGARSPITYTGPVPDELWWKLDDGTGTTAADSSGNGFTGTFVGSPTWVAGVVGSALQFSGSNQAVEAPANEPSNNDTTSDTVCAWFKTTSDGVILSTQNSNRSGANPVNYEPLLYIDTSGFLRGGGYISPGSFPTMVSSTPLNDGGWHHGAVTFDTSGSGTQSLYIDGQFVASNSGQRFGLPAGGSTYWYIGTGYANLWPNTPGGWFDFNGTIDDARIYGRTLSGVEIASIVAE